MSYRVEVASSGRAGCQSTDCKREGVKIGKNELRLGTWVDIPDRGGSWKWRHWGCVTGKIIQNIRQALDRNDSGEYSWSELDGYEGIDEKSSLHDYPHFQDKVRRVIAQGYIDPEDFRGDPEMNKLGCTGLRSAASKKVMRDHKKREDSPDLVGLRNQLNTLIAERKARVAEGAPTSKIDKQFKIVEKALAMAEEAKALHEKPPKTKKTSQSKRGREDDESDGEKLEHDKEKIKQPVKKKRLSARDKKVLEKFNESDFEEKVYGRKVVKQEGDPISSNDSKIFNQKVAILSSSGKIKEEEENTLMDIAESEKHIKPKRGRPKNIVKKEDRTQ